MRTSNVVHNLRHQRIHKCYCDDWSLARAGIRSVVVVTITTDEEVVEYYLLQHRFNSQ